MDASDTAEATGEATEVGSTANVEGNINKASISEDFEDNEIDKCSSTIRYWKEGILGTVFQSYLDAIDVITFQKTSKILRKVKCWKQGSRLLDWILSTYPPCKLR